MRGCKKKHKYNRGRYMKKYARSDEQYIRIQRLLISIEEKVERIEGEIDGLVRNIVR